MGCSQPAGHSTLGLFAAPRSAHSIGFRERCHEQRLVSPEQT